MENCYYDGQEICSFDLKDDWGIYQQERVVELKRAAAEGRLYCTDCAQPVYLAAGLIREPYFAHYDAKDCPYGNSGESEELRLGKRLIYQMLKRSFPLETIKVRYKIAEDFYTGFYITLSEGKDIALDFRLTQLPIKLFDKRKLYYMEQQIQPVFMLGSRQDKDMKQLNWYQGCVQELLGYCIFFDASTGSITLKRSFSYQVEQFRCHRVFEESYPIDEITLNMDGTFACDFLEHCRQKEEQLKQELEEQARLQHKEKQRQEAYVQEQMMKEQEYEKDQMISKLKRVIRTLDIEQLTLPKGIRKDILVNCISLIEQGDLELVSLKYIDFLLSVN